MSTLDTTVVISQPMFFPWVGLFEQLRLANVYVHYGDVQFSKGSFVNRVQIKTVTGIKWLTVPLEQHRLGQAIDETRVNSSFRPQSHLDLLKQAYAHAPYLREMIALADQVYATPCETIGALSRASIAACCEYFGLHVGRQFREVGELAIGGSGSERVLDIVKTLGGTTYVSGLGGRNYLDHEAFERAGVSVKYMDYHKAAYPQQHQDFTPYVSVLDLIANTGRDGIRFIRSEAIHWRNLTS